MVYILHNSETCTVRDLLCIAFHCVPSMLSTKEQLGRKLHT